MATTPVSSRKYTITPADNGNWLDLGPASSGGTVGTFVLQFNPKNVQCDVTILVGVRAFGEAAKAASLPFLPAPYRRVVVNNVASDYAFVSDLVSGPSIIQVPSNGLSVGLLVSCTQGSMDLCGWDLNGPSAP